MMMVLRCLVWELARGVRVGRAVGVLVGSVGVAEAVMAGRVRVGRGGLVVGCGVAVALAGGCGVAVAGDWLAMVVPAGVGLTARLRAMNQVPLASNRMIPQMRREASRIMGRDGPAATDVGGAVCWGSWKPQLPQKAAFGLAG